MLLALGCLVDMTQAPTGEAMSCESEFRARDNIASDGRVTWSTWKVQQSRTGVYGDPTVVSAEIGEKVLPGTVEEYVKLVCQYHTWDPGLIP
jgi:creatinine amidohydrolase/Fe(II)-dependent formamide hydrolase-like protein